MPSSTPALTPWTDRRPERVTPALRSLLALPEDIPVAWEDKDPHARRIGQLAVSVTKLGEQVRLLLHEKGGAVKLRVEHPKRATAGVKAVLQGYRSNASAERFAALGKELRAWRTRLEVEDHILRRLVDTPVGPIAMLRTGFGCSQDCSFCWQGRDWPEPDDEMYTLWVDQMAAGGARLLTISGGEPTLRRFLPALIERAAKVHGLPVHLQTNAIRLRSESYVRRLTDAGLRSLLISFHSADPDISNTLTRAPKTWKSTVKGIRGALKGGLWVALNCVVESRNATSLAAHARFIVDEFVTPFPDNPIRLVNYSQPGPYYDRALYLAGMANLEAIRPALNEAVSILSKAGVQLAVTGTSGFPPCTFASQPEIVGWVSRDELDARDLSGRAYGRACEGCAVRTHCVGVRREYLERFGDAGLQPFSAKPIALTQSPPRWQLYQPALNPGSS